MSYSAASIPAPRRDAELPGTAAVGYRSAWPGEVNPPQQEKAPHLAFGGTWA